MTLVMKRHIMLATHRDINATCLPRFPLIKNAGPQSLLGVQVETVWGPSVESLTAYCDLACIKGNVRAVNFRPYRCEVHIHSIIRYCKMTVY